MLYHSTNNPAHRVDLKEAILRSLPPDNGLYMPDTLPVLGDDFWADARGVQNGHARPLSRRYEPGLGRDECRVGELLP